MGLIALVSSASSTAISLLSPVGVGVGGMFVSAALVVLLGYLDLFDASGRESQRMRQTLVATIVPLAVVFTGVVVYQSLQVV